MIARLRPRRRARLPVVRRSTRPRPTPRTRATRGRPTRARDGGDAAAAERGGRRRPLASRAAASWAASSRAGSRKPVAARERHRRSRRRRRDRSRRAASTSRSPCGAHHVGLQAPGFEPLTLERDPCADAPPLVARLVPRSGAAGYETVVQAPSSRQEVRLAGRGAAAHAGHARRSVPRRRVAARRDRRGLARAHLRRARQQPRQHGLLPRRPAACPRSSTSRSARRSSTRTSSRTWTSSRAATRRATAATSRASWRRARAPAPEDDVHASVDVRLFDAGAMVTAPLPGSGSVAVAGALLVHGRRHRRCSATRTSTSATGTTSCAPTAPSAPCASRCSRSGRATASRRARARSRCASTARSCAPRRPSRAACSSRASAVGADHSEAPIVDQVPDHDDAVSALPRLAFTRPTKHVDFEVGFDGELEHFDPVTMLDRVTALDLGQRRTARLLAGYASAIVRAGPRLVVTPELRLDSYAVTARSDTQKSDLGPRLSRAPRGRRPDVAQGLGRPLHAAAEPAAAGPGRRELRPRALRPAELVAGRARASARRASGASTPASPATCSATCSPTCATRSSPVDRSAGRRLPRARATRSSYGVELLVRRAADRAAARLALVHAVVERARAGRRRHRPLGLGPAPRRQPRARLPLAALHASAAARTTTRGAPCS